ncbi:MAG: XRE family transcriptional regulator [Telluria sp.]
MSIHQRIRERRTELGLSQADLAALVGVSQSAVQLWEKEDRDGGTAPQRKRLDLLAGQLKVSAEWLLSGNSANVIDQKQEGRKYAFIARYQSRFQTKGRQVDHHIEIDNVEGEDTFAYRRDWLDKRGLSPHSLRVYEAADDSMLLGDQMLVDITARNVVNNKPFLLDGAAGPRVRRLFVRYDGQVILRADNPAFPEEVAPMDALDIVGQVVAFSGMTP